MSTSAQRVADLYEDRSPSAIRVELDVLKDLHADLEDILLMEEPSSRFQERLH